MTAAFPPSPEDWERVQGKLDEIRQGGQTRHDRAILLGYHEASGIGNTLADVRDMFAMLGSAAARDAADPTFHVWRLDQPSDTAKVFRSVAAVDEYLAGVATLPRYYLEWEGNPRVVVGVAEDAKNVRITDTESSEHFDIRKADLEGFRIRSTGTARLCVHADAAPTIGDWIRE
jgi:hypothetical protein